MYTQEVGVAIEVTVQHGGWFEFRICPNNDFRVPVTHECLNRNLLSLADGSGYRKYLHVNDPVGFYNVTLRLPTGLTCTQCVLQWKWHTGKSTTVTWLMSFPVNLSLNVGVLRVSCEFKMVVF